MYQPKLPKHQRNQTREDVRQGTAKHAIFLVLLFKSHAVRVSVAINLFISEPGQPIPDASSLISPFLGDLCVRGH